VFECALLCLNSSDRDKNCKEYLLPIEGLHSWVFLLTPMDLSLSLVGFIVINLDVTIGPLILGGFNLICECYPW
jgi:hypothetical protein